MRAERPENTWNKIWSRAGVPAWDQLSDRVYSIVEKCLDIRPKALWVEAGSGTGRVSIRLAEEYQIDTILVDTSVSAVRISKKLAGKRLVGNGISYVVGSIFHLPIRSEIVEVVWNSGVLEHFSIDQRQDAIEEFMRCLKTYGKILIIAPNRFAIVYNIARIIAMKIGAWPYGYEEPMSYRDLRKCRPNPDAVFSVGLLFQFKVVYVPYLSIFLRHMTQMLSDLSSKLYDMLDLSVAGYFLIAIWSRKDSRRPKV